MSVTASVTSALAPMPWTKRRTKHLREAPGEQDGRAGDAEQEEERDDDPSSADPVGDQTDERRQEDARQGVRRDDKSDLRVSDRKDRPQVGQDGA